MSFWIPWGVDALIALVAVGFFLAGLADGSVSSFNLGLWLGLLLALAVVVAGSLWLRSKGRRAIATALVLLLAIPGLLAALFFVVLIFSNPRWN